MHLNLPSLLFYRQGLESLLQLDLVALEEGLRLPRPMSEWAAYFPGLMNVVFEILRIQKREQLGMPQKL